MDQQITMREAAAYLGVSRTKVWRLVSSGILPSRSNPLDRRQKLVPLEAVEHLRRESPGQHHPHRENGLYFHSDGVVNEPDAPRAASVDEYLAGHWYAERSR